MTPLAAKAIQTAIGELGVHEDPIGSNTGPRVNVYQSWIGPLAKGESWCVAFAIWCCAHAAHALGEESRLPKTDSTSELYRWYVHRGLILPHPEPGCIGMLRGGPTGHEHTFIVLRVGEGLVYSVDGNWGNAVRRTTHPIHQCDWGPIV